MVSTLLKAFIGFFIGAIILLIFWSYAIPDILSLLQLTPTIDTQSYNSFQLLAKTINKLTLDKPSGESFYKLKDGYSLIYLNPDTTEDKIKKKYPGCGVKSCLCLCQDISCDKFECEIINKKFKNSGKITDKEGFLNLKYDINGVSIEPKQK